MFIIWLLVLGDWRFILNICIITSSFPSHPDDHLQVPFIIDFIEAVKKQGHLVFVYTQDRPGAKRNFLEGVEVRWFPWIQSRKPLVQLNPLNPLEGYRILNLLHNGKKALLPFVREHQIDTCLGLWVFPGGYFSNFVYRRAGVPYSVWALGSDIYRYGKNPFLYLLMKRIIHEARGVFADGFDLAKRIEERFGRKCSFLPTTREIPPAPLLSEEVCKGLAGRPENPYRFLFVGRLEKVKGVDVLLQAMRGLIKENPNVHLTLVGEGSMGEWVSHFIERGKWSHWITLEKGVPDKRLSQLYACSGCVVIPSRSESIPLVFSEALKFNREMIVTDVGDMGMLGRQYGVAEVVPPEDSFALKETMRKKVESRHREKQGQGGEELKRLFNIETSVERFLKDYQ